MTVLSICIPTFNRLDCLENCLESILISSRNVDDFNFEVCISDNFSNENPISIIEKYNKDLKIIYNRNEQNLGFALNAIKTALEALAKVTSVSVTIPISAKIIFGLTSSCFIWLIACLIASEDP